VNLSCAFAVENFVFHIGMLPPHASVNKLAPFCRPAAFDELSFLALPNDFGHTAAHWQG